MQHDDDVVADDARAVEAFVPARQDGPGQAVLLAREREGEAQRQTTALKIVVHCEPVNALCYVVKQLSQKTGRKCYGPLWAERQ
jgi:hypothetical protein